MVGRGLRAVGLAEAGSRTPKLFRKRGMFARLENGLHAARAEPLFTIYSAQRNWFGLRPTDPSSCSVSVGVAGRARALPEGSGYAPIRPRASSDRSAAFWRCPQRGWSREQRRGYVK